MVCSVCILQSERGLIRETKLPTQELELTCRGWAYAQEGVIAGFYGTLICRVKFSRKANLQSSMV